MAFNLNTLKNLFGKLAPYAGTAMQVADTGMGIASIASNLGGASGLGGGASNNVGVDNTLLPDLDSADDYGYTMDDKELTEPSVVGIRGKEFHYPTSGTPSYIATKTRLLDSLSGIEQAEPSIYPKRVHNNTALGKWYAKNRIM